MLWYGSLTSKIYFINRWPALLVNVNKEIRGIKFCYLKRNHTRQNVLIFINLTD